jgi:2-polyprenyl-3-methyl-5-hydroxy-6-metoxy-1,4-benzoquinol methylase
MTSTSQIYRTYLKGVVRLNALAKSAAVRLTKVTGKSRVAIHPKHLIKTGANQQWYLEGITAGCRVLDVGCGNGAHALWAASRQASVVGIDYNWLHLKTGRILGAEQKRNNLVFLYGSVEQRFPFRDQCFDRVLLLDVIEHLYGRVEVLREINRVLRPGGMLFLSAPNRETSWKQKLKAAELFYFTDPDHKIEYTWKELQSELKEGGFEPQGEPLPIVYDTPWAGLIDLSGGLSLSLYRRLSQWKMNMAQHYPQESIGWRVVCRKTSVDL